MSTAQLIELTEYIPRKFEREEIDYAIAETLWRIYNTQVALDFPSPKTGGKWKLTSQGWVGHIPLTPEFHLALLPKVQLKNLFGMLEYAYQLKSKSFRFLQGLINCSSLEDFYSQLAYLLARRILDRGRKGFYRAYVPKTGQLAYVRGRLNTRQAIQKPWDVKLTCHYEEHSGDTEENQILAWTLFIIGRSGLCSERVSPTVRQAYHTLQGFVTLQPTSSKACVGRLYNRLNEDYRPLHALCRFFLESSGASHERGDRTMLPFLVDMAKLYELFVSAWLQENPPQGFFFKKQHPVEIGQNRHFRIDLILCHVATGEARAVLDTKYKAPDRAADTDIYQMISYAKATRCSEAFLIYPIELREPLDIIASDIRVRSLTFSLEDDLDRAGQVFLQNLLVSS
jgi:5-methylcytosine-specific restriction enzyme subunit McrC